MDVNKVNLAQEKKRVLMGETLLSYIYFMYKNRKEGKNAINLYI